jgi:hypothetical protein
VSRVQSAWKKPTPATIPFVTHRDLSDAELDEIERLCVAASRAPWTAWIGGGIGGPEFISVSSRRELN